MTTADNRLFAKDASAREPFRRRVNELYELARGLGDGSEGKLHQAQVRMKGNRRPSWEEAVFDLSLAEHRCKRPDLKDRIKKLHDDVSLVIYG